MNKKLKTLDDLVGFYIRLGYTGLNLKKILENDEIYTKLLKDRQKELTKKFQITRNEMKKYVLLTDKDVKILTLCKMLEKGSDKEDKYIIRLIKTQLEEDWRTPLIKELNRIKQRQ